MELLSTILSLYELVDTFDLVGGVTPIDLVTLVAKGFLLTAACWGGFLMYAGANAAKARPEWDLAPWYVRSLNWSLIAGFGVVDVLFNATIGALLFLEMPRVLIFERRKVGPVSLPIPVGVDLGQLLFTGRCSYHKDFFTWRGDLARWVCYGWLNPIDPGHCHLSTRAVYRWL